MQGIANFEVFEFDLNFPIGGRSFLWKRGPMDPIEAARQRTLVLQCQLGSRAALEELYLSYAPPLGYYVRRLLNRDDVDDVEQEVWLAVIRHIGRLRTPEAFVVWLYRIARGKAVNRLADRRVLTTLDEQGDDIPADDSDHEFTSEDAARVHAALSTLSTAHREVLTLRFLEHLSYEQIADVIDCKLGTVRSRIHHAKIALRHQLESAP